MRISLNPAPVRQYIEWDFHAIDETLIVVSHNTWTLPDAKVAMAARCCGYTVSDNNVVTDVAFPLTRSTFWFDIEELHLRGFYPQDWKRCCEATAYFATALLNLRYYGNVYIGRNIIARYSSCLPVCTTKMNFATVRDLLGVDVPRELLGGVSTAHTTYLPGVVTDTRMAPGVWLS